MQTAEKSWLDRIGQEDSTAEDGIIEEVINEKKVYVASYLQLMWWRFIKHRLAVISAVIVLLLYFVAAFAEFVAPYNPENSFVQYKLATPSSIHMIDSEGNLRRPFVYKIVRERDPETLRSIYTEDTSIIYPIRFFVPGQEYKMWGLFNSNLHLFGLDAPRKSRASSSWAPIVWGVILFRG